MEKNWGDIKTAKQLKVYLLNRINELKRKGLNDIASKWELNLTRIPSRMNKEAINYILLSAHMEVNE